MFGKRENFAIHLKLRIIDYRQKIMRGGNMNARDQQLQQTYRSVLFIDAGVADAEQLIAGAADDVLVVKLAAWRDGVEQMADVLRRHEGLDSIQIVSHGEAGRLQLGTATLDDAHLDRYAAALKEWGGALRDGGDLLIYGCDVAQGTLGMSFVDALALASGADVGASSDLTGAHGDWDLEYSSGAIEAASAISLAAQQSYAGDLPLVNGGVNGTITFNTSSDIIVLNQTGLAPGAVVHADNIRSTGLDLYAQSTNGGGITVLNANGNSLIGLIPLSDDRITVNGSLLSPVSYVDLRANSGVFDMLSINLGGGGVLGGLVGLLGTVVYTVYALDANYQPIGVGSQLLTPLINDNGLLNFQTADFKGVYGIRIVNPLGLEVAIDDVVIANARPANTVTSAAYNADTGVLNITATGIAAGHAIDPSKFTVTGQGGATYTLTSPVVSAASATSVSITLNAADKLAVGGILNKNGAAGVDGTSFNLAAAANWDGNLSNGQDLTGNAITVSNVPLPTITSASYNAATHVLTVTGSNLVGVSGAANDITVAQLSVKGEGGVSRALLTTGNVEVNSATSFSVTLSGADIAAVELLLNKSGTQSAGGTTYQLSAGDDWNSVVGNANTSVSGVLVVVGGVSNSAPTITGTATAGVGDNATLAPFSGVTVADINGDNVSMTISYNSANGTLSGTGLSGSAGSYTLSAATPAALTAQLKALVFTPTANQAAVGVGVATSFTLTATDSNGAASAANSSTVVTATSVNDAPVFSGTAAGQGVAAGATVRPFSAVVLSDPDVGASVIVTITPDSAAKGAFTPASLSASGFSTTDGGVTYTHAAAAPGAAQAALQALVFQSTPGISATTSFTVSINDGSVIVSNSATSVVSVTSSSTIALTVAFSSDSGVNGADLITNVAAQTISGTLSGGLASGETVEVSLDNGATWTTASAAVGASTWQLAGQTLSGAGTLQVRVANAGGTGTPLSASYDFDNTAPSTTSAGVAFSADTGASPTDLVTKTAAQTISGTLSANLAADEHVEVSLNNGATWTTASASAGGNAWTLAGQTISGSNTLQVRVVDAAGNAGAASSNTYSLDTTGPTASLSSNVGTLKSGESAVITVTFNEAPAELDLTDFSAVGGTLGNLTATANPRVFTLDFTPNGGLSGLVGGVSLSAGTYTDSAGNNGGGASSAAISITTLGPSVVITSDAATLKAGESANITFTFTSAPSGFATNDISVTGGSLGALTNQGGGVYTAVFTPGANVSANASITVAGGSYTDILGNQGGGGVTPLIVVDTKAPTLAITSSAPAVHSGDTATITFTFSEAPLGFTSGDITATGGTLSAFTIVSPQVYTAVFTPDAGVAGAAASITLTGGYTDLIGNAGTGGASPSLSIDTLPPSTVANSVAFSADTGANTTDLITKTAAQTVSGTLSAALVSGEVVQVSLDHGQTWVNASAAVGATTWSLGGRTLTGSDTLQVRVNDAAGNQGAVYSAGYVLDTTAPTVTVSSDAAALRAGQSANLTFTFSEEPSNFTAASLNVVGGSVGAVTATGNALVYTAVFTPVSGQSGVSASVGVKAAGYTDPAGNNGQASATVPIAVNTALPTLAITSSALALKAGETAQITFTFSQPPTGFTDTDISVGNGTLSGFAATANPSVYTAVFTPDAGLASGAASISVAGGSYADVFGNSGGGGSALPIGIDTLAPTVAITSSVAAVKAGETALITFTFSEAPVGFTSTDIATSGGTLSGLSVTADPLVYTALFTPTAGLQSTSASITIANGAFTDLAGNGATASSTPSLDIDTLAPTAIANGVLFSADTGGSATDLLTNTAAQTISGTLATALGAGESVQVSLDNGGTWTNTTAGVGNSWTLAGQTLSSGAGQQVQVRVIDAAGNHGAVYAAGYVLDTSIPTATVSASAGALKIGETAVITFTFSEAPIGFTDADLTVSGGTLGALTATANPLVYTAVFTPAAGVDGGGAGGIVSINPAGYLDAAGNNGAAAVLPAIGIDTLAPSTSGAGVVFSSDTGAAGDLVTSVAAQNLSGTVSANLQNGETVEVSLNNGVSWISAVSSAGGNAWSLAGQTLSSGAGHQVQVRVSDAAGNHGTPFSAAYTLDQAAPTLAITSAKAVLNSADTPVITFTFSEAPVGFDANDIAVTGGGLTGFAATANPLVYTAIFTPVAGQAAGVGTIAVTAGSYLDAAGNSGLAAAVTPISYATVAPGLAITSNVAALKIGETATINFKFSTAPVGFAFGDIVVAGGALGPLTATADPLVFSAVFTPSAGLAGGNAAISVASGLFTDAQLNAGVGGSMTPISIDTLAPTLSITSSVNAVNGAGTALITFTFSEAPAVFSQGDVTASNGSLSNLTATANPLVYTALFTPAANVAAGNAVITVAAGAFTDLAGNGGPLFASPGIAVDTVAPLLAGSSVLFSADTGSSATDLITRTAAQSIAGTLSGGVLAVGDVVEVSFNNGANWTTATSSVGGTGWVLSGQTLTGPGTLQVRVSDASGNHGTVSSHAYTLDTTAPTVVVSSDVASLRAGQAATISFTFSEAPAGFVVGDLIASGGSLSGFTSTANPLVYTVLLTPTPGINGSASVTLGNNLYTDIAGNSGGGGVSPSISVDTLAPTLQISSSATALKAGETATITFTFSDAPLGFALGDISAAGGTLSGLAAGADPKVYTATFTPTAGTAGASAVISVAAGLYTDMAGNAGAIANSAAIAIDTLAPATTGLTVAFSADHGASNSDLVTNAATQILSGTLSAPLAVGETVQVSLDNGAHWLDAAGSPGGSVWALPPQLLSGGGTLQVRVADAAGNTGPAISAAYVLDLVAPTMTVTSSAAAVKAGESVTLTFTFSEAPSGFTQADLVPVNGSLSGFAVGADPRVYTVLLTPDAGLSGAAARVTLAPGMYTDVAGNAGAGLASSLITVDTAPPALQIASSAANLRIGEQATITFTFSEAPLGFAFGDVSVSGGVLSGFGLTANPLVYTAIFTPTQGVSGGSASITVAGGSYLDAAGNAGLAAAVAPISFSTLAPTTGGATVTFSSDTGVSSTDLVTNFALQNISGTVNANLAFGEIVEVSFDNGANWSTAVSAPGAAAWSLAPLVLAGSGSLQVRVTDAAGNHGAATTKVFTIDTGAPSVAIASSATTLKAGDSATLTFTFSEAPQGFIAGDLVVTGGAISGFTVTADARVYTAVFTPTSGYSGSSSVTLPAGAYSDIAGNAGAGLAAPAISVDAQAPTLIITSSSPALKSGDTALISFTFSEAPLGFAVGDVSVSGGSLSGFTATANPLVYTAVLTPAAGVGAGNAVVSVAPNVYGDAAGNSGGAGAAPAISIDTLAPAAVASGTPSFSNDTGSSATDLVTSVAAQTVSGTLSAPLVAGDVVQVSFDDGATWDVATTSVGGGGWSLARTLTSHGVLRVRVADAVGNHSGETVTNYTFDQTVPTVAISSNVPTASGAAPAIITFTFSEAPAGFGAGDVAVTGGTLGAITATDNPLVYTATFTPTPGVASGSATIGVTGGYADAAGNGGAAGAIPSLQIDTVAPTAAAGGVQFSSDSGVAGDLVTNNPTQTLSGTLSAAPAPGEVVQVSLNGGTTWTAATVSGSTWTLAGATLLASGTLMVRVADAAGNASTAHSAPYTVDTQAPTVTISSNTPALAAGQSAVLTLTLSDAAVLTLADIVVSGGVLSNFSGGGTTYTVTLTPPANSSAPLSINVAGQLFTDTAGNGNAAAAPLVLAVDTNPPAPPTGTPTLVDGVEIRTQAGVDTLTGLPTRTVSVPFITSTRPEDTSTEHANLADIPLGIAPNAQGVGTELVVSLPVGIGFEATGPASLLSGDMALTDLIGRIDDHTAAGQATRVAMESQARAYLDGLGASVQQQHATLTLSGAAVNGSTILVTGDDVTPTSGGQQGDNGPGATSIELVIDTRQLPQGIGLQLDDVDFAAIIGAANVSGGAGKNFIIGDAAAQHIVLTTGSDNDSVFGNDGDDVLGTAAGNDRLDGGNGDDTLFAGRGDDALAGGAGGDVLQGGRSDSGQWQFYLKDGKVVGQHQMALTGAAAMETVQAVELNHGFADLAFSTAAATHLQDLSLLYHAAFERAPDLAGLSFWSTKGMTVQQLAEGFLASPEAQANLLSLSNQDYVAKLLQNSVGRTASAAETANWVAKLDAAPGDVSVRAGVFADIALTAEHKGLWVTADGVALGGELLTQEQGWIANSGDDRLDGGAGSDLLVGGDGVDTVVYTAAASSYSLSLNSNGDVMIVEPDGARDTVRLIERGEFNGVALDLSFTQAGKATLQEIGMLYQLTLDRAGDFSGFLFWVNQGLHGVDLARGFTESPEFQQRYGGLDDAAFVTLLYQNVTQQDPNAATLAQWDAYLDSHSRSDLVAQLAADTTLIGTQFGTNGLNLIGSL
jgi:hypothetical protein